VQGLWCGGELAEHYLISPRLLPRLVLTLLLSLEQREQDNPPLRPCGLFPARLVSPPAVLTSWLGDAILADIGLSLLNKATWSPPNGGPGPTLAMNHRSD